MTLRERYEAEAKRGATCEVDAGAGDVVEVFCCDYVEWLERELESAGDLIRELQDEIENERGLMHDT